ncbi:MAG: hypothetical protein QF706_07080, partial [Roseibacillus sp.]|nr:hypothetical protein [Roseibacillus sp.]
SLAWLRATSSDPNVRDGPRALGHATFMMQAPGVSENPALLGTLAAAYAAAGKFPEAANTTTRVINILESRGVTPELARHRERLKLYQEGTALSLSRDKPAP